MNRFVLLIMGMLLCRIQIMAYETQNGLEYLVNTSSISHVPYEAVLYKCINDVEVVNIPDKITVKYQIWTGGNNYSNQQATIPVKLYNTNIGSDSYQPFVNCKKVKKINIAADIERIDGAIFNGCVSLEEVNINNSNKNYISVNGILYSKDRTAIVRVPPSAKQLPVMTGVSEIGSYAFAQCPIEDISVPASIVKIGKGAFTDCTELKKVYTPSLSSWLSINFGDSKANPLFFAHHLYLSTGNNNGGEIMEVVIPQQTTTVNPYCFAGAFFKNVSFNGAITNIGDNIFVGGNVDSLYFAKNENISYISRNAFNDCEINKAEIHSSKYLGGEYLGCIKKCYVGEDITKLPVWAFRGFAGIVVLHDNITEIGSYAFREVVKSVLVKRGSLSLLNLLNNKYKDKANYIINDIDTGEEIKLPSLVKAQATQTTLLLALDNKVDGFSYSTIYDKNYREKITDTMPNDQCLVTGLNPEYEIGFSLMATLSSVEKLIGIFRFSTEGLSPKIKFLRRTATAVSVEGIYGEGDAVIDSEEIAICTMTNASFDSKAYFNKYSQTIGKTDYYNNYYLVDGTKPIAGNRTIIDGLKPSTSYYIIYTLKIGESKYRQIESFATPSLTLTTLSPKVTNAGEAMVSATTNMADEETNAGFEWRKTDAPDVVESRQGGAVIYNGTMEGKIKNLDTSAYWKVRAYYKSNSGNMYYGDWIGFDPNDFSYFEPTVHTYSSPEVNGTSVTLAGAAVEGTDEIQEQGFEYWNGSANARESRAASNVQRVTANIGQRMTATVTDLPNGTYTYRSYVKTEKGTFYGEEQTFTITAGSGGNETKTLTITTSKAGYATFYDSQESYTLPTGLTAQVVTGVANDKLIYETIGSTIPKGIAVVLIGSTKATSSYDLTTTSSASSYSGTNLLRGSDAATTTTGDGYHYKLSYGQSGSSQSSVFGWYWGTQDGAAFQIEAHKAWLVLPRSAGARSFSIVDEATEIQVVDYDGGPKGYWYDLQGRLISEPTVKGIYLNNGKKVMIK